MQSLSQLQVNLKSKEISSSLYLPLILFFVIINTFLYSTSLFAKEDNLSVCISEIVDTSAISLNNLSTKSFDIQKEEKSIKRTLTELTKDLQSLLEKNKEELIPRALEVFSDNALELIGSSNNIYLTLLSKINSSLKGINTPLSFTGRISILPESLCQSISIKTARRIDQQSDMLRKGKELNITTEHFSTQEFNRNSNSAWVAQTTNKLEGLNFNINYKSNIKTINTQLYNSDHSPNYDLQVSGGVIISLPRHFSYPLNIPIYLQYLPTFILKNAFFEYSPQTPDKKNYVTMNIDPIHFTKKGMSLNNSSQILPEIHFFFSDEVHYDLQYLTRYINFVPSLERPTNALLGEVVLEKCEKIESTSSKTLLAKLCDNTARINVSLNHLILYFTPAKIKVSDPNSKLINILLPNLRVPNTDKGEVGGLMFLPRRYNLIGNKQDRKEWFFSFYINSNKYAKIILDRGVAISNNNFKNHTIGTLSVINELKKPLNLSPSDASTPSNDQPTKIEDYNFELPKRTDDISAD